MGPFILIGLANARSQMSAIGRHGAHLALLAGDLPSWGEDAVALRAKLSTMIDNNRIHTAIPTQPPTPHSLGRDPASAKRVAPALASLEQRVAALEAEKTELDNYKRRLRNEMSEHETKARETILCDFLEVADNLERAIASWKEAARGTSNQYAMA